ncbi:MAG TPA: cell wall-binding repeat-containing protein, partial [Euzebya sp.]|nr:cell wall-binding repeat-containing protein [Euzebya sp.]
AYAAGTDVPLLLVRADALPAATIEALQRLAPSQSSMLVGDAAAINPETEQAIRDLTDNPTERLSHDTPALTAARVAGFAIRDGATPRSLWLATSARFPDALAASAAVGSSGGVLLLTDGSEEADATVLDFLSRYGPVAEAINLVGGTAAIPPGTESRVAGAVSLD